MRHWMSNHEATVGAPPPTGAQASPAETATDRRPPLRANRPRTLPTASATCSTARRATWRWTATAPTSPGWARNRSPGPANNKGGDHFLNFIDAVRSRKREDLHAEIEEGAASTVLVHLANISYRVGRTIHFDAATMTIKGDAEANKLLTRNYRKPFVVPEKV